MNKQSLLLRSKQMEISVIICTYNTKEITLSCLDKLKESINFLKKRVEVILIDNGNDGTGREIKNKYTWVKLIEPKENTGFAKGNNLGIKVADKNSKYYLFLNTDAFVNRDTLSKSISFMDINNECSVLGCKLKLDDGSTQPSAGYLPTPLSVFTWMLGIDLLPIISHLLNQFHPKFKEFFMKDRRVGWVMGAFLFMRGEVVATTHGFDENFFMYTEEVELCKRINDAGYEIWYTPSFEITHLDKSSSKSDPEKLRKIAKNEIVGVVYFLKKYYPNRIYLIMFFIKLGLILRLIAFFVLGDKNRMRTYLETLKEI